MNCALYHGLDDGSGPFVMRTSLLRIWSLVGSSVDSGVGIFWLVVHFGIQLLMGGFF